MREKWLEWEKVKIMTKKVKIIEMIKKKSKWQKKSHNNLEKGGTDEKNWKTGRKVEMRTKSQNNVEKSQNDEEKSWKENS